jgi:hypothetical protein
MADDSRTEPSCNAKGKPLPYFDEDLELRVGRIKPGHTVSA